MKVLLLEDDKVIGKNVQEILSTEGYVVEWTKTIAGAKDRLSAEEYDCVILDRRLPDGEGLELVREIRAEESRVPIMMLTALGQTTNKVKGLDAGADDYLAKPFEVSELVARVRALIRRGVGGSGEAVRRVGQLTINTNSQEVNWGEKEIALSPREYAILEYLAYHSCEAVERVTLLTHVWGDEVDLFSNTVDVHIRYLRRKLGRAGAKLIKTVRGKGYMLCDR